MLLLDTDICIYLLNGRFPAVAERLRTTPRHDLGTTAITAAELRFGALNSGKVEENLERAATFLAPLTIVPFDALAAVEFARLKAALSSRGDLIGTTDLLIASSVLAVRGTLVTNNLREFRRVPGLAVESWAESEGLSRSPS